MKHWFWRSFPLMLLAAAAVTAGACATTDFTTRTQARSDIDGDFAASPFTSGPEAHPEIQAP